MPSTKASGSPLASLISQWCHQQQQAPKQESSALGKSRSTRYRILLQSTTSLETRLQAAQSLSSIIREKSTLDEEAVYRRAGLRTPAETALREFFVGPAGLVRILEIGTEVPGEGCHVVFLRTRSRESFIPKQLEAKMTILDCSQDPWGWDGEEETASSGEKIDSKLSLRNLSELLLEIRSACENQGDLPVLLVWESLAPLILVHGLDQTLRFLEAVDSSQPTKSGAITCPVLQVWSIRTETLTPAQHARLEDAANALLCSSRGEMTLMPQGIREKGNVIRDLLPFRLVAKQERGDGGTLPFRLEEQADLPAESNQSEAPALVDESQPETETPAAGDVKISIPKAGRSKIQLRMESDDEVKAARSQTESESSNNLPRIYLQDDDPEFADMDEEDPDDDLDI